MADIVIFGNGKAAQVARYFIEHYGTHRIAGFTVDEAFKAEDSFDGYPMVAWERLSEEFPPGQVELLGPLTPIRLNAVRRERYLEGKRRGYAFASFIHPDNSIHAQEIGENCFILERNVIHPFSVIGDNVLIWTQNHIGHHCVIGDHSFISVGVLMGGSVRLGAECYVSGGVGFVHGLKTGARCAILNSVLVTHDLEDDAVLIGPEGTLKDYPSSRIRHLL